jgi:hypothetical protein
MAGLALIISKGLGITPKFFMNMSYASLIVPSAFSREAVLINAMDTSLIDKG